MLAVEAEYDNGIVRWMQQPPAKGAYKLMVVFEPKSGQEENADTLEAQAAAKRIRAIRALQEMTAKIQNDGSLVDELISERRKEAARDQ